MRNQLRVTAEFDEEIAAMYDIPGLKSATILDDNSGVMHAITIEYEEDGDDNLYRRLNYSMRTYNYRKVHTFQNKQAQELLHKIAASLTGSSLLGGRVFSKGMIILPQGEEWDEVFPSEVAE